MKTFMLVTLSCHLIFMIGRRCLIMKACSFFTCLLYSVHVSAPYSRMESMITADFRLYTYGHIVVIPESFSKVLERHTGLSQSLL